MEFQTLLDTYRTTLLDDIVPFWIRHAIDPDGAINNCIADDGSILSRDRWVWSQWRALWVFSKLYNCVETRPEWLDIARGLYGYLMAHGPLDNGHWPTLLDGDGSVKMGYESIYVDGFAVYALVEFWRATQEDAALEAAVDTYRAVDEDLAGELPPPAYPYPIERGAMAHGVSMIFSQAFDELAEATGVAAIDAAADRHHRRVMETFLREDRGLVLEWLGVDEQELAPPKGTVVNPGHAIESMWFQIHIARRHGDEATAVRAAHAMLRHLEFGWDDEFGGIFLARDADGHADIAWKLPDSKIWWPHTEALYGTLIGYEVTGDQAFLDWHDRVHDYAFQRFPVPEHGEWRPNLDRQGNPINEVVALPVKDPFHLPRALIYCIDVLERLVAD
jgi:N-acylglucosamine 2-epimerase